MSRRTCTADNSRLFDYHQLDEIGCIQHQNVRLMTVSHNCLWPNERHYYRSSQTFHTDTVQLHNGRTFYDIQYSIQCKCRAFRVLSFHAANTVKSSINLHAEGQGDCSATLT